MAGEARKALKPGDDSDTPAYDKIGPNDPTVADINDSFRSEWAKGLARPYLAKILANRKDK